MNMVVPIALLRPVLDELLSAGRVNPPRPWLGMYAMEGDKGLVVGGLSENGPAAQAGLQAGDRLLAVGETEIADLPSLWRSVWKTGGPGVVVPLRVRREGDTLNIRITSADRTAFLRRPKLH